MNLVKDPQFYSLAEFLSDEASLVLGGTQNVLSNGKKTIAEYLNLTNSLSHPISFQKNSSQNVNNGFGIDEINVNDVSLCLRYVSNDIQATDQKILIPVDLTCLNVKNYYNKFFTFNIDAITTNANLNNQSIVVSLMSFNTSGWEILGRTNFTVLNNPNYNLSSHPNYRLFKNYRLLFKTLKKQTSTNISAGYTMPPYSDRYNSSVFIALDFPKINSTYSVNIANVGLFFGRDSNGFIGKEIQNSQLSTKTKVVASTIVSSNIITNSLTTNQDLTIARDLRVNRNSQIDGDLRVVGASKLGTEIQFLSNTNSIQGRITKSGQLASSKFTFLNGDGTRGELDAVSLQARYADLAEYHRSSKDCEIGDLVQISKSNEYEIELCSDFKKCIGVVSENPCFKMNSGLEDLPPSNDSKVLTIGYLGIIQVKIKGKINKGDFVSLSNIKGVGKKSFFSSSIKSLEYKSFEEISLVKCLVQY